MLWGTGSQAETLSYTATGQLKQNKKALETLDYDYDATDRLTEVKRNDITLANYQYDPFGRRMSKEVNGECTYFLYSDEGLIAELNDRGNTQVAYGWMPDSAWGTNPLWQANLTTGQTLKNAAYHYLHTDHLGTPQIATNQAGNITWQAEAEAFGETHLNESNQITMNLRFPGQYYDAETDTHYNYFRDYNPRTGRYQQSDPIGLLGGINHYGYVGNMPLMYFDPLGLSFMDPIWGGIYKITGGWSPSDRTVNAVAGFGDGIISGMSFGFIDSAELRKRWDIGNVALCAPEYKIGRVSGTVVSTLVFMKGGIPKESIHFTTSMTAAKSISRNGLKPSRTGFFGAGSYTSSIGPFPYNIFVPSGSKIPVRIKDMGGYVRVFPGTFNKPTFGGYGQLGVMAAGYNAFVNRSMYVE